MTTPEKARAAFDLGTKLSDAGREAFGSFCMQAEEAPPTKREELLIKVLSMQIASSIVEVLDDGDE